MDKPKTILVSALLMAAALGAIYFTTGERLLSLNSDNTLPANPSAYPTITKVDSSKSFSSSTPRAAPTSTNSKTTPTKSIMPPPTGDFLRIVYPNGGEIICLGKAITILWESRGFSTVSVRVRDRYKTDAEYNLGAHRATTTSAIAGSFTWKVGETSAGVSPRPGPSYEMYIKGILGSTEYSDTSDKVFSIAQCK